MIHLKKNPTGIDVWIQQHQQVLYKYLTHPSVWNLKKDEYDCFGRVYRNNSENGYIPEAYLEDGEFRDVYANTDKAVQSFYGLGNNTTVSGSKSRTVQIHLVFWANMERLKPKIKHRPDEEVRLDVESFIREEGYGMEYKELVTGVVNVFNEYPGRLDMIKHLDMYPNHCFRFNMEVTYDPITK
jgi:hypothetical protein